MGVIKSDHFFILTIDTPLPIKTSFSCDFLAATAKEIGIFLGESKIENRAQITSGSLFLNRRTPTDWVHTGIVVQAKNDFFHTIEGNTNDEGSREGYELCKRIRGYKNSEVKRTYIRCKRSHFRAGMPETIYGLTNLVSW